MIIFRIFGSLARLTAMLAAGTFLLAAADNASAKDGVAEVPAALNPDKLSIFRVVSATGVQVYTCTRNPAGATGWILKGPDAQLFDPQNRPVGKHYAGPTWEGLDGGKLVGEVKTSMPAPRQGRSLASARRQIARGIGRFHPGAGDRPHGNDRRHRARRRLRPAAPVRNCAFPTRRCTYF
jgi:hypothetical protein